MKSYSNDTTVLTYLSKVKCGGGWDLDKLIKYLVLNYIWTYTTCT